MNVRNRYFFAAVCLSLCTALSAPAGSSVTGADYLGRWEITLDAMDTGNTFNACWLEVNQVGDTLNSSMLWRWGGVTPVESTEVVDGELLLTRVHNHNDKPYEVVYRAKLAYGYLTGLVLYPWDGTVHHFWGRPWKGSSSKPTGNWGEPVELFNGTDLSNWLPRDPKAVSHWYVEDGVMTNTPPDIDLHTKEVFDDFKLEVEFKMAEHSNSGIYLRGRYEVQLLEDYGKPVEVHGNGAVYSRIVPTENASKPAGEWQKYEITLIGRRLTVILNGKKIVDDKELEGITGGALSSAESTPGPIMLQGDHGKVYFRKVTITPMSK